MAFGEARGPDSSALRTSAAFWLPPKVSAAWVSSRPIVVRVVEDVGDHRDPHRPRRRPTRATRRPLTSASSRPPVGGRGRSPASPSPTSSQRVRRSVPAPRPHPPTGSPGGLGSHRKLIPAAHRPDVALLRARRGVVTLHPAQPTRARRRSTAAPEAAARRAVAKASLKVGACSCCM